MKRYTLIPEFHRVVVKQFKIQTEAGESKIIMHDAESESIHQAAHTFGEIVAIGHTAFTKDRYGDPCENPHSIGDHVYFKQYPGPLHHSMTDDLGRPQGDMLYTINDVDILGHVEIEETSNE